MSDSKVTGRRPIASRESRVFQRFAAFLAARGISPNAISVSSMVFAGGAGVALAGTARAEGLAERGLFLAAALLVQGRLLANLLDGMVAVEHGKASATGELYNEVPDRVADAAILIGAGYASGGVPTLGYVAAVLAVFVAYVRALGAAAGAGQVFVGPLAKPQRMAVITVACLYAGLAPSTWPGALAAGSYPIVAVALGVIIVGAVITGARRLARIASALRGEV